MEEKQEPTNNVKSKKLLKKKFLLITLGILPVLFIVVTYFFFNSWVNSAKNKRDCDNGVGSQFDIVKSLCLDKFELESEKNSSEENIFPISLLTLDDLKVSDSTDGTGNVMLSGKIVNSGGGSTAYHIKLKFELFINPNSRCGDIPDEKTYIIVAESLIPGEERTFNEKIETKIKAEHFCTDIESASIKP